MRQPIAIMASKGWWEEVVVDEDLGLAGSEDLVRSVTEVEERRSVAEAMRAPVPEEVDWI